MFFKCHFAILFVLLAYWHVPGTNNVWNKLRMQSEVTWWLQNRHILKMINFVCPKLEPKCSSCWMFSDVSGDTILTMIQSLVRFSAIFRSPWSIRLEGRHARTFCREARDGNGMIFIEVWIMIPLGCVKKRCVQLARSWREHVSLLVIGDGWGMIRCYFFGASGCNTNLGVCLWCGHGNGKWVSNNFD